MLHREPTITSADLRLPSGWVTCLREAEDLVREIASRGLEIPGLYRWRMIKCADRIGRIATQAETGEVPIPSRRQSRRA